MINEHKLILNPSFLSQRILPLVSVGTSAIGIIAAGTSAGAILVGSYIADSPPGLRRKLVGSYKR